MSKLTTDIKQETNKYAEHSNFVKLVAILIMISLPWLSVDDGGADFIAIHIITNEVIKIQIKSRITIDKKYEGKNLFIAFPRIEKHFDKEWVIVPHDELIYIYTTPENYQKNGGKSSKSVPKYTWNQIKDISIIEPCDF